MASLFALRKNEPSLPRPFLAPVFPLFPAFALVAAVICLGTMIYYNPLIAVLFLGLGAIGYAYFLFTGKRREEALTAVA
jgi:ethanolamine permease